MLRKFVFLLLCLVLPGCIASEEQLFRDGLDFGDEFGFFTMDADDPEEGFLLVRNDQNNSYEMLGVDDGYSSVFVNRVFSEFLVLSGYADENKEFHHLVLHQRGDRYFMLNDGEDDLEAPLEQAKTLLRKQYHYSDYAYRVQDRAELEDLAKSFAEAVRTGFFREAEVELVRSDIDGNADRLAALRQRIEAEQEN
ncbi:MAG: hypothetical protein V7703_05505 [Hyphomicrobiales bacterium]